MPRRIPFETGGIYHVYNRGVAKQTIFSNERDYKEFILAINYYRFKSVPLSLSRLRRLPATDYQACWKKLYEKGEQLLSIIAYVLMPNHFHLLLSQLKDGGISQTVGNISNSYTRYYNTANNRIGPLLQGQFKAVKIDSNSQLLHISRYIHLNPYVSGITTLDNLPNYVWSSYKNYLNENHDMVNPQLIMNQFPNPSKYLEFVTNHADYARELELVKHQLIDIEP